MAAGQFSFSELDNSNVRNPESTNTPATTSGPTFIHHHGSRTPKPRSRKGVDDYVAENEDFVARTIQRGENLVRIMVCRYCQQTVGSRADRIKEHLKSKRHLFKKKAGHCHGPEDALNVTPSVGLLFKNQPSITRNFNEDQLMTQASSTLPTSNDVNRYATSDDPKIFVPIVELVTESEPHFNNVQTKLKSGLKVQLRWEYHSRNIETMFSKYMLTEQFCDMTLCCEGQNLKCHRLVLAACSSYFERILASLPPSTLHPNIFLVDIKLWEVQALLEFMYQGRTKTDCDKVHALIQAAEKLEIHSLGKFKFNEAVRRRHPAGSAGKSETETTVHKIARAPPKQKTAGDTSLIVNPFESATFMGNPNACAQPPSSMNYTKGINLNVEDPCQRKRSGVEYPGPCPLPIKKLASSSYTPGSSVPSPRATSAASSSFLTPASHYHPSDSVLRLLLTTADSKQDTVKNLQEGNDVSIVEQAHFLGGSQKVVKRTTKSSAGRSLLRTNIGNGNSVNLNFSGTGNTQDSVKPAANVPYPVITTASVPYSFKPASSVPYSFNPAASMSVKPNGNMPYWAMSGANDPFLLQPATPPLSVQEPDSPPGSIPYRFPFTPAEDQFRNLSGSDFWLGLSKYGFCEEFMNNLVPRDNVKTRIPTPREIP